MASSGSFNTSAYSSRYLKFSWSVKSQSVAKNSTTISWNLKGAGGATNNWFMSGNFKVVIDGKTVYSSSSRIQLYNGTTVASGTYTMTHNSVGARNFSASAQAGIYTIAVNCSGSGSWSLPTIARHATIGNTSGNITDEGTPYVEFSNPANTNVSVWLEIGSSASQIARRNNVTSRYTWTLTDAERNAIRQAMANTNSARLRYVVYDSNGGDNWSYKDYTMSIVNANPTFSAAYSDTNSATTAITGNNQLIIQNQSSLQIAVTNLSAKKYATISSVTCSLNGTTYTGTISGTSCTFNIGAVNLAANTSATVTVKDSRGNTASQTLNIQVLAWSTPTALVTMQRENNFYSNTTITVDGSVSSVDNKNTLTIKLRYKKVSDSTWGNYVEVPDNEPQNFTLDNNYEWDVQVVVIDLFGNTTYNLVLSRGMPIIYFDRLKNSVGINCFPEDDESLEVNGVNAIRSVMTRYLTADLTNLTANSYVKINLSGTNSFGDKLTATNDGGIKIGAGVNQILVSGRMLTSCSVVGAQYIRIAKNDVSSSANMLCWVSHTNTTTSAAFETINATPCLVNVQENDVIYLYYYVPASSGTIYGNNYGNQTSLTVETVS